jgi:hypothetical protein
VEMQIPTFASTAFRMVLKLWHNDKNSHTRNRVHVQNGAPPIRYQARRLVPFYNNGVAHGCQWGRIRI